ncbi:entericidin A/B family lipoprotein [Phytohalomonas tamaricis]|nr:entericidin A/B family lipoprotein [Phytohalomonas tamaricis]
MTLWLVALLSAWMLSGCNTMHGAGEDIAALGRAIQHAAD